jgi:hypothetical protein
LKGIAVVLLLFTFGLEFLDRSPEEVVGVIGVGGVFFAPLGGIDGYEYMNN